MVRPLLDEIEAFATESLAREHMITGAHSRVDQTDLVLLEALLSLDGALRFVGSPVGRADIHRALLVRCAGDVVTRAARLIVDDLTDAFEETLEIAACSRSATIFEHYKHDIERMTCVVRWKIRTVHTATFG